MASDPKAQRIDDSERLLLKGRLSVQQMHADLLVLEQHLSASRELQQQLDRLLKPSSSLQK